ncbi:putative thiosulfate sulfur transferase [Photobacterium sp. SKA34]|uniref:sulfurtransferase n=1 Tax=Photobacterium sp. SKA34 TaxID=121723 RepID=UPI00006B89DD|nr:rhodanese-like domain-containing protein [Photobacterium sp. SKA34]EAR55242.1 putative thiosulfate sulfur transferase [Photobacterium sp. SKA34]
MRSLTQIFITCLFVISTPCLTVANTVTPPIQTFEQLAQVQQTKQAIQIIDCRDSNGFNGWPKGDTTRGGHIPNAVNIDSQWLTLLTPLQLASLLKSRQLSPKIATVLYGDKTSTTPMSEALKQQGFSAISTINQPVTDYVGKLKTLKNFTHLVSAKWLDQLINHQQPLYAPQHGYKIVEVEWGPPSTYLLSHIPSSLYVNTNDIESKPWWNKVSDNDLKKVITDLGIRYNTTVIVYARNNISAARFANFLMYAGVEDVRLLNGGWNAWENAHYPTQAFINENHDDVSFGKTIPANPQYLTDLQQAKTMLQHPKNTHSLVSIRSWQEYIGQTSGYDYIKPKGRIEGAKWGHAGSDSYHMQDFNNPDGTMKSGYLIAKQWAKWNIKPNQQVAFFCGTGWRASEAFFYAYVMGWKDISVFDGGWYQWSADKNNSIAEGVPK